MKNMIKNFGKEIYRAAVVGPLVAATMFGCASTYKPVIQQPTQVIQSVQVEEKKIEDLRGYYEQTKDMSIPKKQTRQKIARIMPPSTLFQNFDKQQI